jgi:hypothetical protein
MTGSITKYIIKGSRRPRWRFRIYTGKDDAGRKIYEGRGGFAKEGVARKDMNSRMAEIGSRADPAPAPQRTLGDWLQQWLDTYALDRCQPKTLERYRQLAVYVLKASDEEPSALAQTPLADLTHQQLEAPGTHFGPHCTPRCRRAPRRPKQGFQAGTHPGESHASGRAAIGRDT